MRAAGIGWVLAGWVGAVPAPGGTGPAAAPPSKPGFVTLLWLDTSYQMRIDLGPLAPLSPQMRAILAYYAMRANTDCPPGEWQGGEYRMSCALTTALQLGPQCSPAQVSLVQKWFPDGLPPLDDDEARVASAVKAGQVKELCNNAPDSATHRNQWDVIRIKAVRDTVEVHAVESWTSGPEGSSGQNQYDTTFRLLPDRVKVVSHRRR